MYFFVQETVHFNSRTFNKTFDCLDNIKCYSVHSVRQIEFLQFMNISKYFNLKSCDKMRLIFLGLGAKGLPMLWGFHVLFYIFIYLKV